MAKHTSAIRRCDYAYDVMMAMTIEMAMMMLMMVLVWWRAVMLITTMTVVVRVGGQMVKWHPGLRLVTMMRTEHDV